MDRRTFLTTSGLAAAGVAFVPAELFAQAGDAALNALFERIFHEALADSPELATSLGLDKGALAPLKGKLSPATAAERERQARRIQGALAQLGKVDRASLSPAAQLNLDVVRYSLNTQLVAPTRFGIDSVQRPYPIFQQGGAYFSTPDFLNTAHTIRTPQDCEAYLSRLDAFARVLDEESEDQWRSCASSRPSSRHWCSRS